MGMNGHEITPSTLPPTQTGSPTQKSFHGGLNNIISKLIDQKKDENTENIITENTPGTSTECSPVKKKEVLYWCPMKSCETKVTLSNVENHLTTSHPDVYILFKRILMDQ